MASVSFATLLLTRLSHTHVAVRLNERPEGFGASVAILTTSSCRIGRGRGLLSTAEARRWHCFHHSLRFSSACAKSASMICGG